MESNRLNLTLPNHISLLLGGSSLGTSLDANVSHYRNTNNYTQSMHDDTLFCIQEGDVNVRPIEWERDYGDQ